MSRRLFRQRLSCFYCGSRSAQDYPSNIRQWKCEICEALNFLDEKGEITDPPPLDSFSEARYARSIPRTASPELPSVDENLFCVVCLQNQKFLTEALASYFPPANAPDYSEYEENYPVFRKNLEDRYPQVCRQCEPRVRDRIRVAGYAAKTDHLRRMMERSRDSGRYHSGWNWNNLLISAGMVGWWTSLIGQILWDIQGSLTTNQEEGLREESSSILEYNYAAGVALGLGPIFFWWNPALREKSRRRAGRIVGLMQFYTLQAGLLAFRYASWSVLATYNIDSQTVKAIHAFMMVFVILSIVVSFRTVQLDLTPRVLFQDGPTSPEQLQRVDDINPPQMMRPNSNRPQASTYRPPFPISDLAPTPCRPHPSPIHPPTPPPDDDDTEAMDWTPSQKSLPPAKLYYQPKPIPVPSPFYGNLPPAPKSLAHKLRNPTQPTFPKASSAQKESFFRRQNPTRDLDEISELGSEASDTPIRRPSVASPVFAPPKFFPRSAVTDTGLENIFSQTFSIAEEPHEVRTARQQKGSNPQSLPQHPTSILLRLLSVLFLSLSVTAWFYAPTLRPLNFDLRVPSLGVSVAVASRGIWHSMPSTGYSWRWIETLNYTLELFIAAIVAGAVKTYSLDVGSVMVLGLLLLCGMLLQEFWLAISEIRNAPKLMPDQSSSQDNPPPSTSQSQPQESSSSSSSSLALTTRPEPINPQRITRSRSRIANSTRTTPSSSLGGLSLG